jgi:1,2-dihydroxy-3-keto-5-methylthiopentene dioxygenase
MSALTIYPEQQPEHSDTHTEFAAIQSQLSAIGVQFERWSANCELAADADQTAVLAAYSDSIDRLKQQYPFQSVDVINELLRRPDVVRFDVVAKT